MADKGEFRRPLRFMGDSLKSLRAFPDAVKRVIGFELDAVQRGDTPSCAKRLKSLPDVLELVKRHDKDTYRAVYVVNIGGTVCVLHCFKKKSKHGVSTPPKDVEVILQRLRDAQTLSKGSP